mmetsp:Transcript_5990/g.17038  ORF Transcript_5990/g.17038 Transcript_5990/m.17038 type:complete len:128 (+) Transcript_5990:1798-2181(+)
MGVPAAKRRYPSPRGSRRRHFPAPLDPPGGSVEDSPAPRQLFVRLRRSKQHKPRQPQQNSQPQRPRTRPPEWQILSTGWHPAVENDYRVIEVLLGAAAAEEPQKIIHAQESGNTVTVTMSLLTCIKN